jgi:SAM-dependent methyltransferase
MYLSAPTKPSLLLDVGCGNGEFLLRMMKLGWSVAGMDTDPVAVRQAQWNGVAAEVGELASFELPDKYADAITMSHVIEHVPDPVALLRECFRVLKPGGTLSVVTPNAVSLGAAVFGPSWVALDVPRHLMIFQTATLRSIATTAGFAVETLTSSVTGARSIWTQSLRLRRRRVLAPQVRPGLASFVGGLPFQLVERALVASGRELGEELILRGRRPSETVRSENAR